MRKLITDEFADEHMDRLPKWAQEYISNLLNTLEKANNTIDQLNAEKEAEFPNSNVKVSALGIGSRYKDRPLPPDSEIDFYMNGSVQKYDDTIIIRHDRNDSNILYICSYGGEGLSVIPRASNAINIRIVKRGK